MLDSWYNTVGSPHILFKAMSYRCTCRLLKNVPHINILVFTMTLLKLSFLPTRRQQEAHLGNVDVLLTAEETDENLDRIQHQRDEHPLPRLKRNHSTAIVQTRHNFVGEIHIFSVKIYKFVSFIYASLYRENVHAIHIAMQFAKKSRHCVIKIDSLQQRTKIGALLQVAR